MNKVKTTNHWTQFLKKNLTGLRAVGLWPSYDHGYKLEFYSLYAFTIIGTITVHISFQTMLILQSFSDTNFLSQIIYLYCSKLLTLFKTYIFIVNIKLLKQLLKTFKEEVFQPKNPNQVKMVEENLYLLNIFYKGFGGAVFMATFFIGSVPIVTGNWKKELPFEMWYPFSTDTSPQYEIVYCQQIITVAALGFLSVNMDTVIGALMMCISVQIDYICDTLTKLGEQGKLSYVEDLVEVVKHHRKVVSFSRECNRFLNFIILIQFFISFVIMGSGLFLCFVSDASQIGFYLGIFVVASGFQQILLFCWLGNDITVKSNQLTYACFRSRWMEQSKETKKILLIFMMNTQKPIKISSFNLFFLTLETFKKIIHTAWSCCTVLQQAYAN